MGGENDYTSQAVQEEPTGSGAADPENTTGESGTVEPAADTGELDGRGSGDAGSATEGNSAIDNGQNGDSAVNDGSNSGNSQSETAPGDSQQSSSGQLQAEGVGNTEASVSDSEPQVYEGVTASQFDDAMQQVNDQISVLNASCLVLVAALFACFGALCVQTLIRSMTWDS